MADPDCLLLDEKFLFRLLFSH